jgi:hypothetical protein
MFEVNAVWSIDTQFLLAIYYISQRIIGKARGLAKYAKANCKAIAHKHPAIACS